jgi:hypothetical protein
MFSKRIACFAWLVVGSLGLQGAATIVIQNGDPAGVGFNDPTAVAPVGGNSGTTLGQQRLIAFQAAANKWGATLTSAQPIVVLATWEPLSCTSTGAVLGSAGALDIERNFPGAPRTDTWFGVAERNAIVGTDVDPGNADIRARFNVNLGQPGCLDGTFFYLGVDNNHGSLVDLVTVLTHEFSHGLGFQTYTSTSTGAQVAGSPSIWDWFLFDKSAGLLWANMTNAQRVASAINTNNLVWNGPNVTASVPNVLQGGSPQLKVTAPSSVAGAYSVGIAAFGPALTSAGITGEVMPVVDTAPSAGLGCNPFSPLNAAAVAGKIALMDRGTCTFVVKTKNAQNAGAVGAIIVNNVAGSPPPGLAGTDPTITIPTVSLTLADGNALRAAIVTRTRGHSGLFATLGTNSLAFTGADSAGRILMYTPSTLASGSSVSHYDVSAFPNQLMEPAINGDLTHEVTPPNDLTYPLLKDIGWQ